MMDDHRILVVDDDEEIRNLLTRVFSDAGCQVRTAADGKKGLAEIREWEPHMVLLDLEMPHMNGFDVLRHVQANYRDTLVVAFSGHTAAQQLGEDALRLGAVEFFEKPFDLDAIEEVVGNALRKTSV